MAMNVNYNLLKVLDALLTEVHVTRAGERIFLTQAATSNALSQLRDIFDDPLLVRGQGSKMHLTPFAKSLKKKVKNSLSSLEDVFEQNTFFDPKESANVYHIGMSDYVETVMLSSLIKLFNQESPRSKLIIHHMNYLDN